MARTSLNEHEVDAAAKLLVAARVSGHPGPRLPESCRPADLDGALAIQRRTVALLKQAIGGWKCSLPPAPERINAAPILAPTIFRASPCAITATGASARIEPEVAFVLGRDLPSRATPYPEGEVRGAIGETRLVLELLGTRYADPAAVDWLEMMADCVQNQGLFVGPVLADGPDAPLAGFPGHDQRRKGAAVDARRTAWRRPSAAAARLAREFPVDARRRIARGAGRHDGLVRGRDRSSDERDADRHVRGAGCADSGSSIRE